LSFEPICYVCICKAISNTKSWRSNNSKAQLIAQNKPEIKEKQRIAQKKAHEKDPTLAKRKGIGMKFANSPEAVEKRVRRHRERMKADPEYAKKFAPKGFVSGYINNVWFDSSYELLFLTYCFENDIIVKRSDLEISYKIEGKSKVYRPDFIIDKEIIEIKGRKGKGTRNKTIAAKKYCRENGLTYKIIHERELKTKRWFKKPNVEFLMNQEVKFVKNKAVMRWLKKFGLDHTKVKLGI